MVDRFAFPCTSCGLCCRNLSDNPLASELDRGDGICHHLDITTNLCTVYEQRPLLCRIEDFYTSHLAEKFTWEEYTALNLAICHELQHKHDVQNQLASKQQPD